MGMIFLCCVIKNLQPTDVRMYIIPYERFLRRKIDLRSPTFYVSNRYLSKAVDNTTGAPVFQLY